MNSGIILFLMTTLINNDQRKPLTHLNYNRALIDVDTSYAMEKIRVIKKIGPYFPEEYIPIINKAIIIVEKIIKMHETLEFMQAKESNYIEKVLPVKNNQERISYIANTIKKDFPEEDIKKMGSTIETILKVDKYNKLFSTLNTLLSNLDNLNDTDNLIKLMKPFMHDKDGKELSKIKDMSKMFEILQTLDSPIKEENNDKNL